MAMIIIRFTISEGLLIEWRSLDTKPTECKPTFLNRFVFLRRRSMTEILPATRKSQSIEIVLQVKMLHIQVRLSPPFQTKRAMICAVYRKIRKTASAADREEIVLEPESLYSLNAK